jgi:hypothetical protein
LSLPHLTANWLTAQHQVTPLPPDCVFTREECVDMRQCVAQRMSRRDGTWRGAIVAAAVIDAGALSPDPAYGGGGADGGGGGSGGGGGGSGGDGSGSGDSGGGGDSGSSGSGVEAHTGGSARSGGGGGSTGAGADASSSSGRGRDTSIIGDAAPAAERNDGGGGSGSPSSLLPQLPAPGVHPSAHDSSARQGTPLLPARQHVDESMRQQQLV